MADKTLAKQAAELRQQIRLANDQLETLAERRKQRRIAWISFAAGWLGGVLSFVTGIVLSNL